MMIVIVASYMGTHACLEDYNEGSFGYLPKTQIHAHTHIWNYRGAFSVGLLLLLKEDSHIIFFSSFL